MASRSFLAGVVRASAQAARQSQARERHRVLQAERSARAQAASIRALDAAERRDFAQAERRRKAAERESKDRYLSARLEEAERMAGEAESKLNEIQGVLAHALRVDDRIEFSSLLLDSTFLPFRPPPTLAKPAGPPELDRYLQKVRPKSFFERLFGLTKRWDNDVDQARSEHAVAVRSHESSVARYKADLLTAHRAYELEKKSFEAKVVQRRSEVEALEAGYMDGDPDHIQLYASMVLERSCYPDEFPTEYRIAYSPESKQLTLEYELPKPDVVPTITACKYVKSRDEIDVKHRKPAEIKAIYRDLVAMVALRTIHELLESDQGDHVRVVAFNGHVHRIDPATGVDTHPCLISVRTTKQEFEGINLGRVNPIECVRSLGAQVSPHPDACQPVKPIVEFDMVDSRFISQVDVTGILDERPNLMELTPAEFEALVSDLFGRMGLEAKLTRSSKDGGVDAIAFDSRPVLGGKLVIQAKRYRHTVGVSAVRDLFGTMMNEGASKGILVTTSGYGPDAYTFAKSKPIELIDGGALLYLLNDVGISARIVMPIEESLG